MFVIVGFNSFLTELLEGDNGALMRVTMTFVVVTFVASFLVDMLVVVNEEGGLKSDVTWAYDGVLSGGLGGTHCCKRNVSLS